MRRIPLLLIIALSMALPALAADPGAQTYDALSALEALKALEGDWVGTPASGGNQSVVRYEVIAGGNTVVKTYAKGKANEMVTIYHMDGDDLLITHYCMAGNQPTMVASGSGDRITFKFQRATNLASISDGHMGGLKLTFQDKDHFTQEWLWVEDGAEKPNRLEYARTR